jgi:hypothetical protein
MREGDRGCGPTGQPKMKKRVQEMGGDREKMKIMRKRKRCLDEVSVSTSAVW